MDNWFSPYKANILFEFQIPKSFDSSDYLEEDKYLKTIFFDSLTNPLRTLGYSVIFISYQIDQRRTIGFFSLAAPSKYRRVAEYLVKTELLERDWKLLSFYDKSHSFQGGLKCFRFSVPNEEQLEDVYIQTRCAEVAKIDSSLVREALRSIYPSAFVDWKKNQSNLTLALLDNSEKIVVGKAPKQKKPR